MQHIIYLFFLVKHATHNLYKSKEDARNTKIKPSTSKPMLLVNYNLDEILFELNFFSK